MIRVIIFLLSMIPMTSPGFPQQDDHFDYEAEEHNDELNVSDDEEFEDCEILADVEQPVRSEEKKMFLVYFDCIMSLFCFCSTCGSPIDDNSKEKLSVGSMLKVVLAQVDRFSNQNHNL